MLKNSQDFLSFAIKHCAKFIFRCQNKHCAKFIFRYLNEQCRTTKGIMRESEITLKIGVKHGNDKYHSNKNIIVHSVLNERI